MTAPTLPPGVRNPEFWSIDGQPLHTHAWAIQSVGPRWSVPPMRGGDAKFPYVAGEMWLPKIPDSRVLPLQMWLTGADPVTGQVPADARLQWNDSMSYLQNLLWQPDRQFVLGRRWLRTGESGPEIQYAEALGQLTNDLAQTMSNRSRSSFTAEIKLTDPFFYGAEIVSPHVRPSGPQTVINPGDYHALGANVYVDFVGPITNPRLTNTSTDPDVYCGLIGTIAAGETVTLDIADFVAASVKGGVTSFRSGQVYNAGTRAWMGVRKGQNVLTFSADQGTGYAVLRFRPPYV